MMNKAKVELVSFNKDENQFIFKYSVEHNNGKTSVEQTLTISSIDGLFQPKWQASIALDEFPPQKSPDDAVKKLADWLDRLAAALRSGNYHEYHPAEFKEVG